MIRVIIIMLVAFMSVLFGVKAMANHEAGPIYNSKLQIPACYVRCFATADSGSTEGTCELKLDIKGPDGSVVASETFHDVPNDGSRELKFKGSENPISCDCDFDFSLDCDCGKGPGSCDNCSCDTSVAILNLFGKVDAYSQPN